MKHTYTQFVVVGSLAYDDVMRFPGAFADYIKTDKLDTLNFSFVVDTLHKQIGGIATNICHNLALVSKLPVRPIGAVGKDGGDLLTYLKQVGVDTTGIYVDNELYTTTGKVIVDKGENQIWGFYMGAARSATHIDPRTVVTPESLCILTSTHLKPFLQAQRVMIDMKVDYAYDPAKLLSELDAESLKEGITHARWLVGNEYEVSLVLERGGVTRDEVLAGGTAIITTKAEGGVHYQDNDEEHMVPIYRVSHVVNPTGAGDAWLAGFAASMAEGMPVPDALRYANALASFAVEYMGGISHAPTQDEILQRVKGI